jgi:hypothetical protein
VHYETEPINHIEHNFETAQAIGLEIPDTVLRQANEIVR